jgi:hypothetical protein
MRNKVLVVLILAFCIWVSFCAQNSKKGKGRPKEDDTED